MLWLVGVTAKLQMAPAWVTVTFCCPEMEITPTRAVAVRLASAVKVTSVPGAPPYADVMCNQGYWILDEVDGRGVVAASAAGGLRHVNRAQRGCRTDAEAGWSEHIRAILREQRRGEYQCESELHCHHVNASWQAFRMATDPGVAPSFHLA